MFIKWLMGLYVCSLGGGGGGGGGSSAAAVTAAEDRSAALQKEEEARKSGLRDKINMLFGVGGATPENFKAEESELSNSLRGYYGDEQKKAYDLAERQMRFGAANTGNIGSTNYADAESDLAEKNRVGGLRIDEAVQRAIHELRGTRENTRLNAINLVNSGSGEDAVQSASVGLRDQLNRAKVANRENLVGGLFENLAFTKVASDEASKDAQRGSASLPQRVAAAFFPTTPTGGKVYKT